MRKLILALLLVATPCFAQMQDLINALRPDSVEVLYGRPTSSTSFWTIFETLAASQDSLFSSVVNRSVSTGDFADIQTTINYANTYAQRNVYLEAGTHSITNDTLGVFANTMITGAGIGATKIDFNKTTGSPTGTEGTDIFPVFKLTSADSNIIFANFELDGNATNNGNYGEFDAGFTLNGAKNIIFYNLWIHNISGDAITIADECENIFIVNCVIEITVEKEPPDQVGRNGIGLISGNNVHILGNRFTGGEPAAIDIEPTSGDANDSTYNVVIANNNISGGWYGISVNASTIGGGTTPDAHSITIANNVIVDGDSTGIYNSGGSLITIEGNTVRNCNGNGIQNVTIQDSRISNNIVFNNDKSGIISTNTSDRCVISNNTVFSNGIYGINLDASNYGVIDNNLVFNNSVSDSGSFHGIALGGTSDFNTISNNRTFDNQTPKSQYYGISLSASDSNFVTNNFCYQDSSGKAGAAEIFQTGSTGNYINNNYSRLNDIGIFHIEEIGNHMAFITAAGDTFYTSAEEDSTGF
jgi:parallel beta-helix repeat protein